MVTVVLFLIGVVSLLLFDPGQTAFYYKAPITFSWFVKLFSHMVSHGNWKHLMGNFIYGFPYMLYIEHKMQDWKRFLKIFFFCGWIALLGQFLVSKFSMFETPFLFSNNEHRKNTHFLCCHCQFNRRGCFTCVRVTQEHI